MKNYSGDLEEKCSEGGSRTVRRKSLMEEIQLILEFRGEDEHINSVERTKKEAGAVEMAEVFSW